MVRFFQIIKALHLMHGLVLLLVGGIGVFGTFAIGRFIEKDAIDSWMRQAELDASIATMTAQSWLAQSETIISGLALGVSNAEPVTQERFEDLVMRSQDWNSEYSLDVVALVRRMRGKQDGEVNAPQLSHPVILGQAVPPASVHMAVVNSTETAGPLRPSVDLLSMKQMGSVVTTAQRVPEKAILGSGFKVGDRLYSLVAVGLAEPRRDTILVGLVDLSEMVDDIASNYVPQGLTLRISERDSESMANTVLRPIFGPLKAPESTAYTVTIRVTRGQARWNYHWDVTSDYLGGAPTANATMVQIGGLIITILVVYSIGLLSFQGAFIRIRVDEQTAELQSSRDQLRQSHEQLEDLVDQRTNELKVALESERRMKQEAEEANSAKSDFLAGMSHELRTPLNAIIGFSDVMRAQTFGPLGNERYREYADDIQRSGSHLLELINDILDLSKVEAGKFDLQDEPLEIAAQVDTSLRQLAGMAEAAKHSLNSRLPDDLPGLNGDGRALVQLLNNLISNAIKFTPEGGEINVSAAVDKENRILISVSDTGIGMSAEDITKALQPFQQVESAYSRHYQGTGLGLHLCTRIMDLFGGGLEIDSEPGKGTTVTLCFPAGRTIANA